MKLSTLIKALNNAKQQFSSDVDPDVMITDLVLNEAGNDDDGSFDGIFDFSVDYMRKEDIPDDATPWISLAFLSEPLNPTTP